MLTIIFVMPQTTTVTIETQVSVDIIPFEPGGAVITATPTGGVAQAVLSHGVRKIISDRSPNVTGTGIEVVVSAGKDEPPDPTVVARLQAFYPNATMEYLLAFLIVPGAKGDALAPATSQPAPPSS
jgi:hypothetical protein